LAAAQGGGLERYEDSEDMFCMVRGRATTLQNKPGDHNQTTGCIVCTMGYGNTFFLTDYHTQTHSPGELGAGGVEFIILS
jgi:hypothetical protein